MRIASFGIGNTGLWPDVIPPMRGIGQSAFRPAIQQEKCGELIDDLRVGSRDAPATKPIDGPLELATLSGVGGAAVDRFQQGILHAAADHSQVGAKGPGCGHSPTNHLILVQASGRDPISCSAGSPLEEHWSNAVGLHETRRNCGLLLVAERLPVVHNLSISVATKPGDIPVVNCLLKSFSDALGQVQGHEAIEGPEVLVGSQGQLRQTDVLQSPLGLPEGQALPWSEVHQDDARHRGEVAHAIKHEVDLPIYTGLRDHEPGVPCEYWNGSVEVCAD
mmetsp:Transcript_7849/g.18739  ORF Transcript_7849/g.18739 Transcript_7849/m.18739 type:complete len:277 (-) Transcript_7849:462-1292(-)